MGQSLILDPDYADALNSQTGEDDGGEDNGGKRLPIEVLQQIVTRTDGVLLFVEAIGHLTQGLELLKALLDTPERTQQELDLQTMLGPALIATKGWAASEVEKTYARARELCQQDGICKL